MSNGKVKNHTANYNVSSTQPNIVQNLNSDHIYVTEANLRLCLKDHLDIISHRNDWITSFSVALTIVLAIATADFKKDVFGISANTWEAIFYVVLAICVCWFARTIWRSISNRKLASEDHLVKKIRGEA